MTTALHGSSTWTSARRATITERVLDYLRTSDRLVETTLAPAALLANRFRLLGDETDAVELDTLLGYFARFPRLPKLASPEVLRRALADGVRQGLFGLASGSAWDADDAIARFAEPVDPSEIQFQPGTFMVRAQAIKDRVNRQESWPEPALGNAAAPASPEHTGVRPVGPDPVDRAVRAATLGALTIRIDAIPASKAREVVKVAVVPLAAASTSVTLELTIRADGGLAGIPRETLSLVVLEGLRQLGLQAVVEEFPGISRA